MLTNLVVMDDFLDDPDALRARAIAAPFREATSQGFTWGHHAPADFDLRPFLEGVARGLGADVVHDPSPALAFRMLTRKQDAGPHPLVHYDVPVWFAFVCLSPPSRAPGLTRFYRHRASGLLGLHDAEPVRRYLKSSGHSPATLGDLLARDARSLSRWVEVASVAHVYNRLIVMRARQFHQAAPGFGTKPANAKLTVQLAFQLVGSESRSIQKGAIRTQLYRAGARRRRV
jgi:hypothetical protein